MERIKIEVELIVTNQNINDILCTAFEGGISDWCTTVNVTDKTEYSGYVHNALTQGYEIELDIVEEDEPQTLTKEKFISGLRKFISSEPRKLTFNHDGTIEIDAGNIDAADADCIIQYALFDELVYS